MRPTTFAADRRHDADYAGPCRYGEGVFDLVVSSSSTSHPEDADHASRLASRPITTLQSAAGTAVSRHNLRTKPKVSHACFPLDPAAITGFVLGGILVTAGLGYMGWRGWLTYQARKSGEIRLEEE